MTLRLNRLAYQMLGSVHDAEDIVQEAQLRLHQLPHPPTSSDAFLYRAVSNLCIDRLRHLKVERQQYPGPWLPEPYVEEQGQAAELAEDLSMGFLLLLETLSPAERSVYVLRQGFDFTFPEIAELLGINAASARKRAQRANKRIAQAQIVSKTPSSTQKRLLATLSQRLAAGDAQGLIQLLAEDAVVYTDGGGVVSAAIRPIHGRERIAQVALHLLAKTLAAGPLEPSFEALNSGWGLVLRQAGTVQLCLLVDGTEEQIQHIYAVRNPNKLTGLAR